MFARRILSVVSARTLSLFQQSQFNIPKKLPVCATKLSPPISNFSVLTHRFVMPLEPAKSMELLQHCTKFQNHVRPFTKFSLRKGKRKTVKTVLKRFKRLHWGGWVRTLAGRNKHMWKKSASNKTRLRQHVLCNGQQSYMLDKMVSLYWRRPKYYVDDPYEPYHTRDSFRITRHKPWRPEGVDYE